ncbi:MAG: group 1 truncated hemoglobin [Bacteroidales bacterium]|nr:group 1 truncated hemoglobin [Bacteroidales bacterium]
MKQLITVILIFFTLTITLNAQKSPELGKATLFERLGGTEGINKLVDEIVLEHMKNPAIKVRFLPYKEQPERLALIKQHTVEFFSVGSGGPAKYSGRDMVTTHKGMNISREEYIHVVDDILLVLSKNKIDDESKKDVLFILWSLKDMIIGK